MPNYYIVNAQEVRVIGTPFVGFDTAVKVYLADVLFVYVHLLLLVVPITFKLC